MSLSVVLIAVVHRPTGDLGAGQELDLLRTANAWLQRKQAGSNDGLLIIGAGFGSKDELGEFLHHFGLAAANCACVDGESDDLSEAVGPLVERWLSKEHPAAVPSLNWRKQVQGLVYPEIEWWWTGVEAQPDELEALYGAAELAPTNFNLAFSTWLVLLLREMEIWLFENEAEDYETSIAALGLARWLTGFDAVSENNFYDFDYQQASESLAISKVRLGLEAGALGLSETLDGDDPDDVDDEKLMASCLHLCLGERNACLARTLSGAFGGDSALFWALHSSIWPAFSKSMETAASDLVNGIELDLAEVDRSWRFVSDGWGDFSEE